jgi:hypothetical protein
MAILRAYFDESGKAEDPTRAAMSVAGYVGTMESWESFEEQWAAALRQFDVPYLHMKEFRVMRQ